MSAAVRAPITKRVVLSSEERETLQAWTRRGKTSQALALRARIVLACADEHRSDTVIAGELGIFRNTVGKWRKRFVDKRLDGLLDEPRPGAPRKITDNEVERLIAATLESTPKGATHWSTRTMAAATGMSQSAVSRIWRAFSLQPHRPPRRRLPKVPRYRRRERPAAARRSPDPRQSQHAQDPRHQAMVRASSTLSPSLHANERVVDQSGRAVVRASNGAAIASRYSPQHAPARDRDQGIPRRPQRRSEASRVDEDG
jgi:transposase